jgi:hypothetical protein
MYKSSLILLILLGLSSLAVSQDFPYGKISQEEMDMKKYSKDTSAHAVVLQEFGASRIGLANDEHIKLTYEYHCKIKIFNNKGFDNGTIEIPVYHDVETEDVEGITGVTYYQNDNGGIQKVDLDPQKVYTTQENKHWTIYKFAMPGLREGCVIEYKYTIVSPYFQNFHSWHFQSFVPKVYSEYEVHIPAFWIYNASLIGYVKLSKNEAKIEKDCFTFGKGLYVGGTAADCSNMSYGIKDVPAFVKEDYMTSPKNFMSAINFELVEETHPYTGVREKFTKEWKDIDNQLKGHPDFGGQLKRKGLFKDRIVPVIAGKTDDLDKAKAIYYYIQRLFKWNNFYGIFSVDGTGKALDTHSGSVADINIALVTALNAAGINTNAVVLSTRENGILNLLYPVLGDFNYVVARAEIGDKSYLLDATDPLLPFGVLPLRCLNDKGRVMSLDKPSYWVDMNLPQKQKSTRMLDLTLQEDGKLKGTFVYYSMGYEAYKKRAAIKKFNNTDEYIEKLSGESGKVKIIKSEILDLDSLDKPLTERYEIEFNAFSKLDNRIAFNPFFWDRIQVNPFKLNERSFPVDWGMASDDRLIMTIHMPPLYTIETQPQSVAVSMPNNGGKFLTGYEPDNNMFTFSRVIQLNKSIYSPDEYPFLKEFYNKIIQSEKAEIVFKKK